MLFKVQAKEVVIVNNDVSKALLDYINDNIITNIVFGASTRSALQKLVSIFLFPSITHQHMRKTKILMMMLTQAIKEP